MEDLKEFKETLTELLRSPDESSRKVGHTMLAGTRQALLFTKNTTDGEPDISEIFERYSQYKNNAGQWCFEFPFYLLDDNFEEAKLLIKKLKWCRSYCSLTVANACGLDYVTMIDKIETFRDWRAGTCATGETILKITCTK